MQVADLQPEEAGAGGAIELIVQLDHVFGVSGQDRVQAGIAAQRHARRAPGDLRSPRVVEADDRLEAGAEPLGLDIEHQVLILFAGELELENLRPADRAVHGHRQVGDGGDKRYLRQRVDADQDGTGDAAGRSDPQRIDAGLHTGVERDFDLDAIGLRFALDRLRRDLHRQQHFRVRAQVGAGDDQRRRLADAEAAGSDVGDCGRGLECGRQRAGDQGGGEQKRRAAANHDWFLPGERGGWARLLGVASGGRNVAAEEGSGRVGGHSDQKSAAATGATARCCCEPIRQSTSA